MTSIACQPDGHPAGRLRRAASFLTRKRALVTHLTVFTMLGVYLATGGVPRDVTAGDPWSIAALLCIALGLSIRSWAAGTLHKSTVLTSTGPYGIIRNPLYAGSFLMTLGFCALLGELFLLLVMLGPIGWLYVMKVRKEERTLAERFGATWTEYARSTPRFCPRRWPRLDASHWRFSLWARNHEYRAVSATICGLILLVVWRAA